MTKARQKRVRKVNEMKLKARETICSLSKIYLIRLTKSKKGLSHVLDYRLVVNELMMLNKGCVGEKNNTNFPQCKENPLAEMQV